MPKLIRDDPPPPSLSHLTPWTIGIVGSRRRDSTQDFIKCYHKFLEVYQEEDRVVSGGCPQGGDRFAEIIARKMGLTFIVHYPNWNGPAGRGAGIVRNTQIAQDCSILIALVADDRTGGTEDTVKKALKLGKTVLYA